MKKFASFLNCTRTLSSLTVSVRQHINKDGGDGKGLAARSGRVTATKKAILSFNVGVHTKSMGVEKEMAWKT